MTMGSRLAISIVLTMLVHLCRGEGEIVLTQTPVIQVAWAKESVTINCLAILPQEYANTTVAIYTAGDTMVNDIPYDKTSKQGNANTTEISFKFDIQPISGPQKAANLYYCRTTDSQKTAMGNGTFIHVRDTGYVEYTDGSQTTLPVILITSCCILAVLSLAGTILLLLWRKKGYPIWSPVKANQKNGSQKGAVMSSSNSLETPTSGSIYTTLQAHSIDVYDTIEQDIKQDIKNQLQDSTQSSLSQSTSQRLRFKHPSGQNGGKLKTANEVLSTPTHKKEMKNNPERQSVGKKKAADKKTQPAAAEEKIVDTVYENL